MWRIRPQEGKKYTETPKAGTWRPSLPLPSCVHAGHTVSPSSRGRKIAQFLWEELWSHIFSVAGSGKRGRFEPMLQSSDLPVFLPKKTDSDKANNLGIPSAVNKWRLAKQNRKQTRKIHWLQVSTLLSSLLPPYSCLWGTMIQPFVKKASLKEWGVERSLPSLGKVIRCGIRIHARSQMAHLVRNPPAMWETWVWSLGRENLLEKGMATHSSILAWRIPWTVEVWWATVHGITKSQTQLSLEQSGQMTKVVFQPIFYLHLNFSLSIQQSSRHIHERQEAVSSIFKHITESWRWDRSFLKNSRSVLSFLVG